MNLGVVELKIKLFYIIVITAILGHGAHLIMDFGGATFITDIITTVTAILMLSMYYYEKIKLQLANSFLYISIFINVIVSIYLNLGIIEYNTLLLLNTLTTVGLFLYAAFALDKYHLFISSFIYISLYIYCVSYYENFFLRTQNILIILVIAVFIISIYFITELINKFHIKQLELIENLELRNKQLKVQSKELTKLNSTKDKLFSIIGHDLKSPTVSIMGYAELITNTSYNMKCKPITNQSHLDPIKIKSYSTQIRLSAIALDHLLDQLLNWARIQSKSTKKFIRPLNINNEIRYILEYLQGTYNLKQIDIEFDNDNDNIITLSCDEHMILTIIRNFISNAIKFTKKHGKIKIKSIKNKNNYIFSIQDNGIGISKETTELLFKNKPLESSKGTEHEKGTGLGLIICEDYVKQHKGKIWVESELGKGSIFHFSIPLK